MNHSMINSLVSMQGLQQKLDIVANNMANINTTGFKRKEATFHDVLTTTMRQPDTFQQVGRLSPLGLTQGWGAKLSQIQTLMAQGSLQQTDLPTDLAIEGDALFEITIPSVDENGQAGQRTAWTRDGAFSLKAQPGDLENVYLTTQEGHLVMGTDDQPIRVPNYHRIQVNADGTVVAYNNLLPDQPPVQAGSLKLVQVVRPQLMQNIGDNMYTIPDAIDPALGEVLRVVAFDGANPEAAKVKVQQGFLEQSNVNLTEEMTELMLTQRAFQLNAKALTSADNMMSLANSLRG
ncbi:flagellar hook-basal body protein [Paenibacillus hemerocallicola]|jgi:flagellar basal-body rod protein FlgG|uniref:Flagellar hook-basal body protein n=1 Tax=Paenibacillus hemerocallicola TaxID=1172614 RepID=A0A5C4T6X9_9BACL|nr:flagellar hook-basal body protein [Paenibacillus hemerocallicola]TNJ64732.1 flagellar hook-basal body protein [Paenibacillus hemerocallicola]